MFVRNTKGSKKSEAKEKRNPMSFGAETSLFPPSSPDNDVRPPAICFPPLLTFIFELQLDFKLMRREGIDSHSQTVCLNTESNRELFFANDCCLPNRHATADSCCGFSQQLKASSTFSHPPHLIGVRRLGDDRQTVSPCVIIHSNPRLAAESPECESVVRKGSPDYQILEQELPSRENLSKKKSQNEFMFE